MMETIELGPTPCDEPCAQVGSPLYEETSRLECRAYRNQLERCYVAAHGPLPDDVHIKVKTFMHDLGEYREVVVRYDGTNQAAVNAAFWLEANMPESWDDEARLEILRAAAELERTLVMR